MDESWNAFHALIMTEFNLISKNVVVILQSFISCSLFFTSTNVINARKHERFRFGFLVFNFNQRNYW